MNNIFIVCGAGCNSVFLQPVADKFSKQFRCMVYAPEGNTESELLSNLKSALTLFKLGNTKGSKTYIFSHCLGGALAIKLVADNPGIADGLILVNSAPGYYFLTPDKLKASGETIDSYVDSPLVQKYLLDGRELNKMQPQSALAMQLDYREDAKKCTLPTLQIVGAKDGMIPLEISSECNKLLPNNVYKVIENGRHFSVLSHLDLILDVCTKWISYLSVEV